MADLKKRKLKLQLGNIEVEATTGALSLRVVFDIQRDEKPYPNQGNIRVYNLNENHRDALTKKSDITAILEAGYEQNAQQIFFGSVRRATTTREPPDYITQVEAGDGEKELQTATINKSFAKGTPVSAVLMALASAAGLGAGNVPLFTATAALPNGKTLTTPITLSGPVVEELASFCRSLGLSFSIQGGALQLLDVGTPVLPGTAVVLSPLTGLIGAARLDVDRETGKTICVARSLLQPQMVPGTLFVVQSETVNGNFAVRKSRHYGDTHGNDWYVDVEGVEI
jgi:hypothetical protein